MNRPSPQPPKRPRFFYGWTIVAVVAAGSFSVSTESFPVLSILMKPITADLDWSRSTFAAPISIGGMLGGVIAIFAGPLVDRYGSRWALVISFGMLGASFVLMSAMDQLWHLYALQFMARMTTTGVVSVAMAVIIPNWFIVKRGKALSISSLGHPVGATFIPAFVQGLTSIWGWRTAAAGAGLLIWAVSTIPTAMLLRRRPEDMGLLPDGAPTEDLRESSATQEPRRPEHADVSVTLRVASSSTAFYFIMAATTLWWFARTGVAFNAIPYFTDQGIGQEIAVTVIVVHSLVSMIGTLAAGYLRDRMSIRLVMAGDYVLVAASFGLLLLANTVPLAFLWAIVYGISQGASAPLQRLITADYFGRRHLGSIMGIMRAVNTLAQAAGPFVTALFFDLTDSYKLIFAVFIGVNLAAMGLIMLARPPVHPVLENTPASQSSA